MASAWFDTWCHIGPLSLIVSTRDIFRAGFDLSTKVHELIVNNTWSWPQEWFSKYPMLWSLVPPTIYGSCDKLEWRTRAGVVKPFTVFTVWDCIRTNHEVVDWHDVVWFPNNVPRFSFLLWLVINGRLKTQDMLFYWDVNAALAALCPLCEVQPDSHSHLFFDCSFSTQVWNQIKGLARLSNVTGGYKEVVDYISTHAKRRSCKIVVAKLVLSASVYYIWQERNNRLFSNQKRTIAQLYEVIKSSVRLRLLSCSFKKTRAALEYVRLWELPDSSFISMLR